MYEDNRRIEPTGLLSQASTPSYTPSPVSFSIPINAQKPPADWVNSDVAKVQAQQQYEQQLALQQQQLAQAQQSSGGGSVICTRMYDLGYMSDELYSADCAYGDALDSDFKAWYIDNAQAIVKRLQSRSLLTSLLWTTLVNPWAKQMAFEIGRRKSGNLFGKLIIWTGFQLFKRSKYANG